MEETLNVDCPFCQVRVQAPVHAVVLERPDPRATPYARVCLTECPGCRNALVARQDIEGHDWDEGYRWSTPTRVWPEPARAPHSAIPAIVQVSLDEADRCHRAGAHTACAVMCGRALEGVCKHAGIKSMLAKGLQELRDKGLIDQRLFEWGNALRVLRNIAAHASEHRVSKEDATDLQHFVHAICDYVYVLTARFEAFNKRRGTAPTATAHAGELPIDAEEDAER